MHPASQANTSGTPLLQTHFIAIEAFINRSDYGTIENPFGLLDDLRKTVKQRPTGEGLVKIVVVTVRSFRCGGLRGVALFCFQYSTQHMPNVILSAKEERKDMDHLSLLFNVKPDDGFVDSDVAKVRINGFPSRALIRV